MLGAVMFGHRSFQPVIDAIIDLAEACAKEPFDLPPAPEGLDLCERVRDLGEADLVEAYVETVKATRRAKVPPSRSGWPRRCLRTRPWTKC